MTNEEAIKYLENGKSPVREPHLDEYGRPTEPAYEPYENGLIDLAIQALEKQIPVETKWEGESMGIKNLNLDNLYCPSCDYILKEDYRYCPDCGQKLDWSDE